MAVDPFILNPLYKLLTEFLKMKTDGNLTDFRLTDFHFLSPTIISRSLRFAVSAVNVLFIVRCMYVCV